MPLAGFTVGHDVSVDIYDATTGQIVSFPPPTGFEAEQITKQLTSEPLNGYPLFGENPMGWKGTLEFDRYDPSIDNYFASLEALFYSGGNIVSVSITQTIAERTGALSQYRFTGVALKLTSSGKFKSGDKVPVKIDWIASTRLKVV